MRVVSLIASATEIVCALGLEESLVGRSHECDFPLTVKKLPVCTRPKFDVSGTSRQIDERVKSILKDALSVYSVDEGLLESLRPDVIVTQTQCEVCAVSLKDVEKAVHGKLPASCRIVSLEPNRLEDIWSDISRVAAALGTPRRGDELVAGLKDRINMLAGKAKTLAARPQVACIEWIDPLMAAGNWMPALVELAGGINLFGEAGRHSPWMTWEELRRRDPDIIVCLPCGFDLERTRQEAPALTGLPGFDELKAAKTGRVYLADGNQYFNRPGPRVVESLEILAEIFHPEAFDFGHKGAEKIST